MFSYRSIWYIDLQKLACMRVVCACVFASVLGFEQTLNPNPKSTCVGACMCVRICVCAECWGLCMHACTCTCMSTYTYMCVYVCVFMYLCVFVCVSVQTGVRAHMCAYVGACGGCVHENVCVCVCVPFLFLHHLRPGNLQQGWHACPKGSPAHTPLWCFCISCWAPCCWTWLAAVESCEGLPSVMDALTHKKSVKNCPDIRAFKFVVSKASWRSLLTTHSDRINTYIYGKTVYIRFIRRIYSRLKLTYGHTNMDLEKFIYTSIYAAYIYLYASGQP